MIEVACWAHARRRFDEAIASRKVEATETLLIIGQLYQIEKESAEMSSEERRSLREELSRPILDGLFERIAEFQARTTPSETLRKAVDYALNQKLALYRYLQHGRLKPDNNVAENAIRPLALGRETGCLRPAIAGPGPRPCFWDSSSLARPVRSIPGSTSTTCSAAS